MSLGLAWRITAVPDAESPTIPALRVVTTQSGVPRVVAPPAGDIWRFTGVRTDVAGDMLGMGSLVHLAAATLMNTVVDVSDEADPSAQEPMREAETAWLAANREVLRREHGGQWVAIVGTAVIASGPELDAVLLRAATAGHPHPLVTKLPSVRYEQLYY